MIRNRGGNNWWDMKRNTGQNIFFRKEVLTPIRHNQSLFGRHHGVELLVVDLPVSVHVGLLDHGVDLVARQLLAQVHHHHGQLGAVYEPVAVLVHILISKKNILRNPEKFA